KKMGPLTQLLEMIPGMGQLLRQQQVQISDDEYKRVEAIILSMTPEERRNPDIINFSRRRRIAQGSGTSVAEVSQLLTQFKQMQRMMAELGQLATGGRTRGALRGLFGGGNPFGALPGLDGLSSIGGMPTRPAAIPHPPRAAKKKKKKRR
ncbi:MAG: signal recognition particle protein, partial [Thermomicrobium sp.]|nr:signal recognition particle protein [Thermomicrobium sp.]